MLESHGQRGEREGARAWTGVWREAGWEGRHWGLTGSERKGERREMNSAKTNVGHLIESEWGKQMRGGEQKQNRCKRSKMMYRAEIEYEKKRKDWEIE